MPAGVSWPTYLKFTTLAILSMFAGSHTVHLYYRPLEDLREYVKRQEAARREAATQAASPAVTQAASEAATKAASPQTEVSSQ